jgi:hypothetical protein
MNDILEWLVTAEDRRQQAKVKHLLKDIIALVFFAELANASEWIEIYLQKPTKNCYVSIWNCPTGYLPMIRYSGCLLWYRLNT